MHYRWQEYEDGGDEVTIDKKGGAFFEGGQGPEGAVVPYIEGWMVR